MTSDNVCVPDHDHGLPCGDTKYGDTCACGCDATGYRCPNPREARLIATVRRLEAENEKLRSLVDYYLHMA